MAGKCCKCEEFEWPDPQEVAWNDPADEKWYCIFHAPADKKIMPGTKQPCTVKEYNDFVFARINATKSKIAAGNTDEDCSFSGTVFPGDIEFIQYTKDNPLPPISFHQATFIDKASFVRTTFGGIAFFLDTKFFGEILFQGSTFCEEAIFQGATFGDEVNFSAVTFLGEANFVLSQAKDNAIRMRVLTKSSLKHLTFTHFELPAFSFAGCHWPDRLGFEIHGGKHPNNLLACEELYRAMKHRAAEKHDQPQASHWHYREKLMAMKRGGNSAFEQAMLWIYFACSGFGERAGQSLLILVALVVLSLLANAWTPGWDWNTVLPWANAANATLATIPFAKDIPGDGWVKVGRGFWQFLIAIQFTLFALAVRNRFRR